MWIRRIMPVVTMVRSLSVLRFPTLVKEAKAVLFPEKEKKELRGGADGHVLAISEYEPGADFTYYWGLPGAKPT